MIFGSYHKASRLPPALLAVVGFLAVVLLALQYADRLDGLLACCFLVIRFLCFLTSLMESMLVRWLGVEGVRMALNVFLFNVRFIVF